MILVPLGPVGVKSGSKGKKIKFVLRRKKLLFVRGKMVKQKQVDFSEAEDILLPIREVLSSKCQECVEFQDSYCEGLKKGDEFHFSRLQPHLRLLQIKYCVTL